MRLIDADAFIAEIEAERKSKQDTWQYDQYVDAILKILAKELEKAPTVNAVPTESEFKRIAIQRGYVPVVRCKDCKYYDRTEMFNCQFMADCVNESDFCSHGERRGNVR